MLGRLQQSLLYRLQKSHCKTHNDHFWPGFRVVGCTSRLFCAFRNSVLKSEIPMNMRVSQNEGPLPNCHDLGCRGLAEGPPNFGKPETYISLTVL